jgi:hypothetical protein
MTIPPKTPLKSIHDVCILCVGSSHAVKNCGGDKCYFFPYRMGKGRPSVKLIRKFCLECMGGDSQLVAECQSEDCPLHQYRFGKSPKRVGHGDISRIKRAVTGVFSS